MAVLSIMLRKFRVAALGIALVLVTSYVLLVATTPAAPAPAADNRLVVDGMVSNPLDLSFEKLRAMTPTTVTAPLICVMNQEGIDVEPVEWTGVLLRDLLERAGYSPDAVKVAFHSKDGFSTDLNLATALRPDIIVAYEQDGQAITGFVPGGGGPPGLRLVVPGKWGYKWALWLNHIELVNYDFLGTWESNGYSDEAEVGS